MREEPAATRLPGNSAVRRTGLPLEAVCAIDATVGVTDEAAAFAVDGEVVKIEQISATGAGRPLQANGAGLDGVVRCGVDRDPVRPAIVRRRDVEVPDIGAI